MAPITSTPPMYGTQGVSAATQEKPIGYCMLLIDPTNSNMSERPLKYIRNNAIALLKNLGMPNDLEDIAGLIADELGSNQWRRSKELYGDKAFYMFFPFMDIYTENSQFVMNCSNYLVNQEIPDLKQEFHPEDMKWMSLEEQMKLGKERVKQGRATYGGQGINALTRCGNLEFHVRQYRIPFPRPHEHPQYHVPLDDYQYEGYAEVLRGAHNFQIPVQMISTLVRFPRLDVCDPKEPGLRFSVYNYNEEGSLIQVISEEEMMERSLTQFQD